MSTLSVPAVLFAVALGQACAIGLHAWTWRTRQHAIWVLATIGFLAAFLLALAAVMVGGAIMVDIIHPRSRSHRIENAQTLGLLLFWSAVPPTIGFFHAWQLRGHWRPTFSSWGYATLSVFGELSIAALSLALVTALNFSVRLMSNENGIFFSGAFLLTLLVLMLFRPLVLKFVRPFSPLYSVLSEKLRFLHSTVRNDVS